MPTSALASIAFHVTVVLCLLAFGALRGAAASTNDSSLEVQIEEPPPAPPLPPPVDTVAPPPVPVTPAPRVTLKPPPEPVVERPAVQPIPELPPTPVEHPSEAPPKRVVGIEMESTTTAGAGDGWVVGNTPMGKTSGVAEDPAGGGGGPTFVPPRRTSAPQPDYPASLKARSIEGDVGLAVDIDANGRVSAVSVVSSSGHPEFDRSAVDAAWRSTYQPARRDGWPVAHAIEFTVRFRLHP